MEGRNYNLSILLHLFFPPPFLLCFCGMWHVFIRILNFFFEKTPLKRHMCDISQGEYALYMCSTCNSSFILPSFLSFFCLKSMYVPVLPMLCRAIERGNLWVTVYGVGPLWSVSIRLLWSQLHTRCSHPLMESHWYKALFLSTWMGIFHSRIVN